MNNQSPNGNNSPKGDFMLNKNDENKLKKLKKLQILVISLLGVFVLVLLTFGAIILIPSEGTTAPESLLSTPVYITPSTEITVIENCIHCSQHVENLELIEEIKQLGSIGLQDLRAYLLSKLQLDKDQDPIELFTNKSVMVKYDVKQCDQCKYNDIVFMMFQDGTLTFYQGNPENNQLIKTISEDVIFINEEKEAEYSQGVQMDGQTYYIGMYRQNIFGVYDTEPVHGRDPIFIFTNLVISSDLHSILLEEKPTFRTYEEMLELIEAYSGH